MSNKGMFRIYLTKDCVYLQNTHSDSLMEIEKSTQKYSIVHSTIFEDLIFLDIIKAHCFVGIIDINKFKFLIYSSSSEYVGKVLDEHEVYMIKQADYLCLSNIKEVPSDVKNDISGIINLLNLGYFYSFSYDLSNSLQRQEEIKKQIMSEIKENKNKLKYYYEDEFINFHLNYNMINTNNDNKLKVIVDNFYIDNIEKFSKKKYYWNRKINSVFTELNKRYYEKRIKENFNKLNIDNKNKDEIAASIYKINSEIQMDDFFYLKDFAIVIICGYFSSRKVEKSIVDEYGQKKILSNFTLISRRSINYAGTRFNKRGMDNNGNVANYVETEQIVKLLNHYFSFVQLRGSAPIFFQQKSINSKINVNSSNEETLINTFNLHINESIEDHKYLLVVNLLDKNNNKEKDIVKTFEEVFKNCQDKANVMQNEILYSGILKSRYFYFNFHEECKNDEYYNIETLLVDKVLKLISMFNVFCYSISENKIVSNQVGIIRTNCLDSLDRTNIIQSRLAYTVLDSIYQKMNISLKQLIAILSNNNFFCSSEENDILLQTFKEMWAENGDFISLQYAGTESCKTSILMNSKNSNFEKVKVGFDRFIKSNFEDKFKQNCYDLLLQSNNFGNELIIDKEKNTSDDFTQKYFLSDDEIAEKQLRKRQSNYIEINNDFIDKLFIYCGTWNVAGEEIFKNKDLDLKKWLYNKELMKESKPDIYVICFQEIVELNASYILFKSNSSHVDSWKNVLHKALSDISSSDCENSPENEYIIIKTLDLVGILMFVFVKRKYFSILKNFDYLIIKKGASGLLGNKGSVLFRFDLFNKSFAFSSGHYAAGQNELKNRISELYENLHSNINYDISKTNFKGKTIDHDFFFILGDLNFRIDMQNEQVRSHIKKLELERLATYDQLNKLRLEDKSFYCLDEGPLLFPPTYKYNIGTSEYETKKNRIPSWCDRILFKRNDYIKLIAYNSIQDVYLSDHKPVYAIFEINIKKCKKDEFISKSFQINTEKEINDNILQNISKQNLDFQQNLNNNSNLVNERNDINPLKKNKVRLSSSRRKDSDEDDIEMRLFNNDIQDIHFNQYNNNLFKQKGLNSENNIALNIDSFKMNTDKNNKEGILIDTQFETSEQPKYKSEQEVLNEIFK